MARYGQAFKDRAVARLLPPQSAAVELVARGIGIGEGTLERWREDAQSRHARGRAWTALARLEAVVYHGGPERGGQERVVPRARRVPDRAGQVASELHRRTGSTRGGAGQPASHAGRPQAHQGARTRLAAQRPSPGRDGSSLGAVKKSRGDLQQRRERMIGPEDRQALARDILNRSPFDGRHEAREALSTAGRFGRLRRTGNRPAVDNALLLTAMLPRAVGSLWHASAARIEPVTGSLTTSVCARYCNNPCTPRSPVALRRGS